MMLPKSKELPVAVLARCFNKTSATYKYYWMLSILQAAEEGTFHVSKKALFSRMIANAWFTVNYFKLSFGKHDLIQDAIRANTMIESITIDERQEIVFQKLLQLLKSIFFSSFFLLLPKGEDSTSSNGIRENSLLFFSRSSY